MIEKRASDRRRFPCPPKRTHVKGAKIIKRGNQYPPRTEYSGQAPSTPLCIREVPGSNPGAACLGVGFFQRCLHTIVVCLISQIRRMLGQYQPLSTFRTHPHGTHPESSCQCGWKGSGKPQQPAPRRGEWQMYPFLCLKIYLNEVHCGKQ
jgi:hypothetical protein